MSVKKWIGLPIAVLLLVVYFMMNNVEQEELTDFVIAEASQPVFSLLYIAKEKGYFEDEGLNVTFRSFTSGRDALQDAVEGNADLATTYETPVVLQTLAGESLKVISSLHFSNKNTAMLALKSSGIEEPSDLIGKTIAVPQNTNADFFLTMYLASEGIPIDSVEMIDVRPENLQDTLANNNADAAAIWNPHLYKLKTTIGSENSTSFYSNAYTEFSVLVGRDEIVAAKNTQVAAVVRALIRAEQYLLESPEEAKELVISVLNLHSRESIEGTWGDYQRAVKLNNVLVTVLEQEAQWIIKQRKLSNELPNFRALIDTKFIKSVNPKAVTIL
ncbi:NrtA/SsuA/CpmA family ABC transporter substrate-binding protein [Vibrio kyushuensis]|uniref:ABC transporter substrate-binding protein n=1 Tax=Vibrio TaxID=662 RepID=UPI003D129BEE